MNTSLRKTLTPLVLFMRSKGYIHPGGVKYPGGIVYYPRNPQDHKDPEYTPSKLFRVQRIKSARRFPWWQKKVLQDLKIDEENNDIAVVKNIPEINAKLWKVKHLIRVTPITFPYGEPTEEDVNHTILKENGQCIVTKTLKPAEDQIVALDKFDSDIKKMDSTTIKRDSRYKWLEPMAGGF